MKKTLTLVFLLAGISFATFAQENPKKETRAEHKRTELVEKTAAEIAKRRTDHIDKEVQLTQQQRKQIYEIYLKEAIAKIEAEEKASQAGQPVRKSPSQENNKEVHKVLTKKQKKALKNKNKEKATTSSNANKA